MYLQYARVFLLLYLGHVFSLCIEEQAHFCSLETAVRLNYLYFISVDFYKLRFLVAQKSLYLSPMFNCYLIDLFMLTLRNILRLLVRKMHVLLMHTFCFIYKDEINSILIFVYLRFCGFYG